MSDTPSPRAARVRRLEPQTCPRRGEGGVAARGSGPDWWETGRWAATQEEADAEVADFMSTPGAGGIGHVLWSYGGEQPRACSFCGGVHPDDAVALLKSGWHVDTTGKFYKRYLSPPSGQPYPVPPVKLYTMHFSEKQADAFNAALRGEA